MKFKNSEIHTFLSSCIFFLFIFDSGGKIGIRNIGFLIIGLILCLELHKFSVNKSFLLFYLGNLAYLTISVIIAVFNKASLLTANTMNFSLYFLIVAYFMARKKYLTINGYLNAIKFFCVLILVFFFGRILRIEPIIELFNMVSPRPDAEAIKNGMVYIPYQGMLNIVPAAIMFARKGSIGSFFLCLATLAVAPSRFGVLVCIVFFLIIYRKKIYIPILISIFLLICISITEIKIPVLFDFILIFKSDYGGNTIRFGHLKSIIELLYQNPGYLIWGQGPGTQFYTSGFNTYTTSVEISHFDFIRKYGIIYFFILNFGLLFSTYKLYKKKMLESKQLIYAIIAFYIVAISNPVLLSLPFIMLVSICVVLGEKGAPVYGNMFSNNNI